MTDLITFSDLAAEVLMSRAALVKAILILEGETDCRLFETVTSDEHVLLISSNGKKKALKCYDQLGNSIPEGVLFVLDADFGHLLGFDVVGENIIYTEQHDIDVFLLDSPAFERVLREFGSVQKINHFLTGDIDRIRNLFFDLASHLGAIRYLSQVNGWELDCADFDFQRFIDISDLTLNVAGLRMSVISRSLRPQVTLRDLVNELERLDYKGFNPRYLCSGHDIVCILGTSLRRLLGSCCKQIVQRENLEKALRLAIDRSELINSVLAQRIRNWENENPKYPVLAA